MIFDHRMHTTIFVLTYNLVLLLVTLSLPADVLPGLGVATPQAEVLSSPLVADLSDK